MSEVTATKPTPPYISYLTFKGFIGTLKETGVPSQIDRGVMNKLSGVYQKQMLSAFRFFGFIDGDDAEATTRLETLAESFGDETAWRANLKELVISSYDEIVGDDFDATKGTNKLLRSKFSDYGTEGQTLDRAVTFYIKLLTDAGVPFSSHMKAQRSRPTQSGTKKPLAKKNGEESKGQEQPPKPPLEEDKPPQGTMRYPLYFKDKPVGSLVVPMNLEAADLKVIDKQLEVLKAFAGVE